MALGPAGAESHAAAIEAFAVRLRAGRDPREDSVLAHADWATVAAMCALVGKLVMRGEADRLDQLEDEFVAMSARAT
jgi:hypothetical protein